MPILKCFRDNQGFSIIAVTVAIVIMTIVSTGMLAFTVANQETIKYQYLADRLFYDVIAGIEFTRGQIYGGSPDTSFTRRLNGDTISISITGGKIQVTATSAGITTRYRIDTPP